jgi:hypothetical protein
VTDLRTCNRKMLFRYVMASCHRFHYLLKFINSISASKKRADIHSSELKLLPEMEK